jgi:hypothetical protein
VARDPLDVVISGRIEYFSEHVGQPDAGWFAAAEAPFSNS